MSRIRIGKIFGKDIWIGNPKNVRNGEYVIKLDGKKPIGLFLKQEGELLPVITKEDAIAKLNFLNLNILTTNHGDSVTVNPSENYDAISSVTYKKPLLEEKDTIVITENNSTTQIKIGANYDGLDDITVIVNIPENNTVETPVISGDTEFEDSTTVTITAENGATIYYTTNDNTPTTSSTEYTSPITITSDTVIKAIAVKNGVSSEVATKSFVKSSGEDY